MKLTIKKLHPEAQMPTYANPGDACFDIYARLGAVIQPGHGFIFSTGLSVEIPEGWAMMIYSRSGHGFNKGVRLANCVGVIDSGYRGELKVKLFNDSDFGVLIKDGERVAQGMLVEVEPVVFGWAEELSESERGVGGLGSSGA